MASIKDVARLAGVSVSTVSHVMNNTRPVAPRTREIVQRVMKETGYRPNSQARALKIKRTKTIGMLVTSSTNPFFAEVIAGVEDVCFQHGYSLILCNSGNQPGRQYSNLETLMRQRIDGLAVMTTCRETAFEESLANLEDLPKVVLDADIVPGACTIMDDSLLGGQLAAEYLIERGCQRLACLTGPQGHPRSRERLAGFLDKAQASGHSVDPEFIMPGDFSLKSGFTAMQALLSKSDSPPDALFAFNDLMAIGAYRAIKDAGLSIPDDISVIGYDDIEPGIYVTPTLTTIHQPSFVLGAQAAEILIKTLDDKSGLPDQIKLRPERIVRDSVR